MKTILATIMLAATALSPAAPGLVGSWRLVEQRYESGANNLAVADRPLLLEFDRVGANLVGRIRAGETLEASWPAFANDEGPLPVEIVEVVETERGNGVRARYRVRPSPRDDLVLDVVESYRLSGDGTLLVGTMTVRFTGGTANRGSFTLHRVFERAR